MLAKERTEPVLLLSFPNGWLKRSQVILLYLWVYLCICLELLPLTEMYILILTNQDLNQNTPFFHTMILTVLSRRKTAASNQKHLDLAFILPLDCHKKKSRKLEGCCRMRNQHICKQKIKMVTSQISSSWRYQVVGTNSICLRYPLISLVNIWDREWGSILTETKYTDKGS